MEENGTIPEVGVNNSAITADNCSTKVCAWKMWVNRQQDFRRRKIYICIAKTFQIGATTIRTRWTLEEKSVGAVIELPWRNRMTSLITSKESINTIVQVGRRVWVLKFLEPSMAIEKMSQIQKSNWLLYVIGISKSKRSYLTKIAAKGPQLKLSIIWTRSQSCSVSSWQLRIALTQVKQLQTSEMGTGQNDKKRLIGN